jgi:hypothetical protein
LKAEDDQEETLEIGDQIALLKKRNGLSRAASEMIKSTVGKRLKRKDILEHK